MAAVCAAILVDETAQKSKRAMMMNTNLGWRIGLAVVAVGFAASAASAQIVGDDVAANVQASWNTASAGTMSRRAPGNITRAARSDFITRQNQIINQARSGPIISEEPEGLTLEQQVRIDLLNQLFTNLNAALTLFNTTLRANAGLPPLPGNGTSGLPDLSSLLGNITSAGG